MNMSVEAFEKRARKTREIPDENTPVVVSGLQVRAVKAVAAKKRGRGRPKAVAATPAASVPVPADTSGAAAEAAQWREKYEKLLVQHEVLRMELVQLRKAGGGGALSPIAAALAEARAMRSMHVVGGDTEANAGPPVPSVIFPAP
jgi:hypothetical protein